jgi:predicted MFS family arabinose efflux permease
MAMGIYTSGSAVGMVILAPVAAGSISTYGWRPTYVFIGIATLAIMVIAGFLMRKKPGASELSGELSNKEETSGEKQHASAELTGLTVREALRTSAFWTIFATYSCWSIGMMMVTTHMVAYAEDQGLARVTAASIISIAGGVGIVGRLGIGVASDRWGRKPFFILCFIIMGLMMLWLSQATVFWMFVLFAVFWGISTGGVGPVVMSWIGELFGLRHMGVIIGLLAAEFGAGAAIGPPLAGFIYDSTGTYTIAFVAGAILMFICAVVVSFVRPPKWGDQSQYSTTPP